jgi:cysteine-rich repeat protein
LGTPYGCELAACEITSLPDGQGCAVIFEAEGAVCDDGDLLTISDVCDGTGGCAGHSPVCGDSVIEGAEECDDGNTADGDGCSSDCSYQSYVNCEAILSEDPTATDGIYSVDPDGLGGDGAFDVYCDMTSDGGGWTLVVRGANSSACRVAMLTGAATADAPLDPGEDPGSVKMFDKDRITDLKSSSGSDTIGLRFTRDGQGSKYISASCELQFEPGTNENTACQKFAMSYSDSPSWEQGDTEGTSMSCANPLGTDGISQIEPKHLRAMGLYDCAVCFDAWGFGQSQKSSIWVR